MSSGKWRPLCLGLNVLIAVYCSGAWGAPPPWQRSYTKIQCDMKAKVSLCKGILLCHQIQYGFAKWNVNIRHSSITRYINNNKYKFSQCSGFSNLTHCVLIMPYGNIGIAYYKSTLAQVMFSCLVAPNDFLNQFWLVISRVFCHSPIGNSTGNIPKKNNCNIFENCEFKIKTTSPRVSPLWDLDLVIRACRSSSTCQLLAISSHATWWQYLGHVFLKVFLNIKDINGHFSHKKSFEMVAKSLRDLNEMIL